MVAIGNSYSERRDTSFDFAGGIMIYIMILSHICQWCGLVNSVVYHILQLFNFFMPWFFFKAGAFFKYESNHILYFKKNVKKLFIPFLSFSIIGELIMVFCYISTKNVEFKQSFLSIIEDLIKGGYVYGNMPLWFLITLFIVRTIYNSLYHNVSGYLILGISVLLSIFFNFTNINHPLYIINSLTGLFFFCFGNLFARKISSKYIFVICPIIILLIELLRPTVVDMRSNILISGNYLLWFPLSVSSILFFNKLIKIAPLSLLNKFKCQIVGNNSLVFYACHWPLMLILINVICDKSPLLYSWKIFSLEILWLSILLPILSYLLRLRWMKFLIGDF